MIQLKPDVKYRLVVLRQDIQYGHMKKDIRRAIRYIEGLEREVTRLSKELSKHK